MVLYTVKCSKASCAAALLRQAVITSPSRRATLTCSAARTRPTRDAAPSSGLLPRASPEEGGREWKVATR